MSIGTVYLVGAGPSAAGLLTLRGRELLETADVVVHDALVGPEILGMIPPDTRRIDVGKRAGSHPVPQEEINRILLREALAGGRVVRLKGGDPFLFGRGGEELELLVSNGVPFEVVPGVASAFAVPAYAGIPVTHRDFCSSVHIITGHTKKEGGPGHDYEALARLRGTLVFLMGVSSMEAICAGLTAAGMDPATPAAMLERGTTARQRRVVATLASLPERARAAKIGAPAILVVGDVCALEGRFAWAEKRPLGGARVLVTRPRSLAPRLTGLLRERGAEVLELPSIEARPIGPNPALDGALGDLPRYGWLAFTSPTGVRIFFERLRERRWDVRRLAGLRLAAIGSATARELETRGLLADLVPGTYSAAALGDALAAAADGARVLLARARDGSPDLPAALARAGVPYDDVALYETVYTRRDAGWVSALLDAGGLDFVAFTSASTVRGFVGALGGRDYSGVRAACIGESTAGEARRHGMQTLVAREATMQSLVELMITEKGGNG